MPIIPLDTLKLYLGITGNEQDQLLTLLLQTAQSSVEAEIGWAFDQSEVSEVLQAGGQGIDMDPPSGLYLRPITYNTFRLSYPPVQSISELLVNGVPISEENYFLQKGCIVLSANLYITSPVICTYTRGYTSEDLPGDLKLIILELVKGEFENKSNAGVASNQVVSKKVGDYAVSYSREGKTRLADYSKTLSKYKIIV